MKFILTILICFSFSIGFAQTQLEMNQQANDSYRKVNKELNEIYKQILIEYKTDTVFVKNLKSSQRIWITFRDAELKVKYPERETEYYGSIHPVCVANYLEKLTRERINTLKVWITGIEEGDCCSGSVKMEN